MEEKSGLGTILGIFITAIIGIILIGALADSIWENRNTYGATNESHSIVPVRFLTAGTNPTDINQTNFTGSAINLNSGYIRSFSQARWGNGTVMTSGTDYTLVYTSTSATKGYFVMLNSTLNSAHLNSTLGGNVTVWDYQHGQSYIADSTSRLLLSLIALFFAIGMVIWIVGLIWKRWLGSNF